MANKHVQRPDISSALATITTMVHYTVTNYVLLVTGNMEQKCLLMSSERRSWTQEFQFHQQPIPRTGCNHGKTSSRQSLISLFVSLSCSGLTTTRNAYQRPASTHLQHIHGPGPQSFCAQTGSKIVSEGPISSSAMLSVTRIKLLMVNGSLPVHVVDGERPVVLGVPRKAWEAHANVTPWNLQQHYQNSILTLSLPISY